MPNDQTNEQVQALREYLRQPENRVTAQDPISRHQEAMQGIWERALTLTNGDAYQALIVAREAVRSTQQPGESREQYLRRLIEQTKEISLRRYRNL